MADPQRTILQASYDLVAEDYAARFFDELSRKPLDRALLDCFAEQVKELGLVVDVGCGPGQIARYLHERGLSTSGVDLSAEMVALAQRLSPSIPFQQGSMLSLPAPDAAWGGITAFYAIVHLTPAELQVAAREFYRALKPGGLMILSFHIGDGTVHLTDWWGKSVDLNFHFYSLPFVESSLTESGFTIEARIERQPCAEVEHPSRRAYIFARRPSASKT